MSRGLAHQVAQVAVDLPRFATAPLYRSWHLRWGATDGEVAAAMPGDGLVPGTQFNATRAVTIETAPQAVWPWLVQVGCGRAGFYSDDLLDNLARPSLRVIRPALQTLEVGQWVSMSPTPSEATAWKVAGFAENEWLLWLKPDSSWAWVLTEVGDGKTRLVTRVHVRYDWSKPLGAVFGLVLLELGDFAMMRRMLLGIKERAETSVC
jgi:hypothetical protein